MNQKTPTLVCLHFLGGSARTWSAMADRLGDRVRCLALDLPGFGDAAAQPGAGVAAMADSVAARVAGLENWLLAGHSMGAKVAAVLARRAEDGDPGLGGLRGLVLASGSPPGPEPMQAAKRAEMLELFSGPRAGWAEHAGAYVDGNAAGALPPEIRALAVADVMRMNREAWVAWLQDGSTEDWADRVGVLRMPALILCGSEDDDLGEAAQRVHTLLHLARYRLETLCGAGHLLPLERPDEVARLVAAHMADIQVPA